MKPKRVAQLRTYAQFKTYCETVGADFPVDEIAVFGDESPLAQPYCISWTRTIESLRGAANGRLGWRARREAIRLDETALASLWKERRKADLGRRGGGCAP